MINKDKLLGKLFVAGPFAMTDIHNGGTVFGIIYYRCLEFISKNEVRMTNKVTFNRGMKDWQDAKEKELWIGLYTIETTNKYIKCELNYLEAQTAFFFDLIDEDTLMGEAYFMSDIGKGIVFSKA